MLLSTFDLVYTEVSFYHDIKNNIFIKNFLLVNEPQTIKL